MSRQFAVIRPVSSVTAGDHILINGREMVVSHLNGYKKSVYWEVFGTPVDRDYRISEKIRFGGKVAVLVDIQERKG